MKELKVDFNNMYSHIFYIATISSWGDNSSIMKIFNYPCENTIDYFINWKEINIKNILDLKFFKIVKI